MLRRSLQWTQHGIIDLMIFLAKSIFFIFIVQNMHVYFVKCVMDLFNYRCRFKFFIHTHTLLSLVLSPLESIAVGNNAPALFTVAHIPYG